MEEESFNDVMGHAPVYFTNEQQRFIDEHYQLLPVDADGEVIHIGDVMDTEHFGTVEVEGFVHSAVAFYNYSGQPAYICTAPANTCHHHVKPTVEDVLRDFADEMNQNLGMYTGEVIDADDWRDADAKTVEKFAAKLRLANDGKDQ